jgi:hypothetical protein
MSSAFICVVVFFFTKKLASLINFEHFRLLLACKNFVDILKLNFRVVLFVISGALGLPRKVKNIIVL